MIQNLSMAAQLELKVGAAIPGLLIHSYEHEDALRDIMALAARPDLAWNVAVFDVRDGLRELDEAMGGRQVLVPRWWERTGDEEDGRAWSKGVGPCPSASHAIESIVGTRENAERLADDMPASTLLIMKNHQFWLDGSPVVQQLVANRLEEFKRANIHIVLLSPTTNLPPLLTRLFESGHIKHQLPDHAQLRAIANGMLEETDDRSTLDAVADAAAGMTRVGAEDAFGLSLRLENRLDPSVVFDLKAEAFSKSSKSLQIYRGNLTLQDYGGAPFLKEFVKDSLAVRETNPKFRPRGVLILGPGGGGKSYFAKCLGSDVGRTVAMVRLAANKSKYQGESFDNTLQMFDVMRAMSPCVAFFDEVEGQIAGGKDTGATDGGVKGEMNSELLSFMDNRDDKDVFILAAANNPLAIVRDMPEFLRAGRFDAIFFMDYPSRESKDAIWEIHLRGYGLLTDEDEEAFARFVHDQGLPDDRQWTGAEIEACCAQARRRRHRGATVKTVGKILGTVASRASDTIDAIREWAENHHCWSVDDEELYSRKSGVAACAAQHTTANGRRRVLRQQKDGAN